jgi:hypothetical protein
MVSRSSPKPLGTSNLQHRTPNIQGPGWRRPLVVRCWALDVGCFPPVQGELRPPTMDAPRGQEPTPGPFQEENYISSASGRAPLLGGPGCVGAWRASTILESRLESLSRPRSALPSLGRLKLSSALFPTVDSGASAWHAGLPASRRRRGHCRESVPRHSRRAARPAVAWHRAAR